MATNPETPQTSEAVAVKKDNILPIVAVSLAGAALLTSLFTAGLGAAVASPERHQEREHAPMSQEYEGKGYSHTEEEGEGRQERNRIGEQSEMGTPRQGMPQMDGTQSGQHMNGKMAPNTNTGAS